MVESDRIPRVSRLFPSASRMISELTNGTTAIITCTCGLNPSNDSACDIYRIYERKRADIQDCRRLIGDLAGGLQRAIMGGQTSDGFQGAVESGGRYCRRGRRLRPAEESGSEPVRRPVPFPFRENTFVFRECLQAVLLLLRLSRRR